MNRYSIIYYKSAEEMIASEEQLAQHVRFNDLPYYNWNNKQFAEIEATTLSGALRAFTMSNPSAIVCHIEDLKLWNVPTIVG